MVPRVLVALERRLKEIVSATGLSFRLFDLSFYIFIRFLVCIFIFFFVIVIASDGGFSPSPSVSSGFPSVNVRI